MSITVSHETTQYKFYVDAPEGEHFLLDDQGDTVAVKRIEFKVTTDGARTLSKVGVFFYAHGHKQRPDGTITRSKRLIQGGNLKRIPLIVRLALQEGIREAIGTLDDPLGQLDGYDGGRRSVTS